MTDKEEKPLDPFFEQVRDKARQARSNTKLKEVLAAILGGRPASLSKDETTAHIFLLPEQYVALCKLVGVKAEFKGIDDGPEQQLRAGSEEVSGPGVPLQEEGNEPGEDSSHYDPMEQ